VCPPDLAYRPKRLKTLKPKTVSSVQDFISTKCIIDHDGYISVNDLHQAYQDHISPRPFEPDEIEEGMLKLGFRKYVEDQQLPTRYCGLIFLNSEIISNQPSLLD